MTVWGIAVFGTSTADLISFCVVAFIFFVVQSIIFALFSIYISGSIDGRFGATLLFRMT